MPTIKRRNQRRRGWTMAHLAQLRTGFRFFPGDWTDPTDTPDDGELPSPEILADMRACWMAHGAEIKAACDQKSPGKPSWGELVFERGMTSREAFAHRSGVVIAE